MAGSDHGCDAIVVDGAVLVGAVLVGAGVSRYPPRNRLFNGFGSCVGPRVIAPSRPSPGPGSTATV